MNSFKIDLIKNFCKKTGFIITVEENVLQGGFGSAILELLEDEGLNNIKVKRIGLPDKFIEHGSQSIIRDKYRLTPPAIASTISEFLSKHGFQKQLKFINNAKKAVG